MSKMDSEILKIKFEEVERVHEKISPCFLLPNVDDDLKKEYRNKTAQYRNMLQTLETMKADVETDDAIESLVNQQLAVIKKWVLFEFEIAKRL